MLSRVGEDCATCHTFICEDVTVEDEVFLGHGVLLINEKNPRAAADGRLQSEDDWEVVPTLVQNGASIGSGAIVICGETIGGKALIGAGAVGTQSAGVLSDAPGEVEK